MPKPGVFPYFSVFPAFKRDVSHGGKIYQYESRDNFFS